MQPGVYFAYMPELGAKTQFKIGWSDVNVTQRIAKLQTGNPFKLELYGYISTTDSQVERFLHRKLKKYRGIGEWFNITKEQVDIILALYDVGEEPETTRKKPKTNHDESKQEFSCKWCGFVFNNFSYLEMHEEICTVKLKP